MTFRDGFMFELGRFVFGLSVVLGLLVGLAAVMGAYAGGKALLRAHKSRRKHAIWDPKDPPIPGPVPHRRGMSGPAVEAVCTNCLAKGEAVFKAYSSEPCVRCSARIVTSLRALGGGRLRGTKTMEKR